MKRTGFKRPVVERVKPALVLPDPSAEKPRATMKARAEVVAVPKFGYVRSPALMRAYRLLPCQHCGVRDGTVAGAHSNWAEHGKGRGIKASDIYCASLCSVCHHDLDQGNFWTNEQKRAIWQEAHEKTMRALILLSQTDGKEARALRRTLVKLEIVKP